MKFSEQITIAMFSPSRIKELINLKKSKHVLYVMTMIFIVTLAVAIIPFIGTVASFGGFEKLFGETIPHFEVVDGKFTMEKDFSMDISDYKLVMTGSSAEYPASELSSNGVYFAVGSEKIQMIVVNDDEKTIYQERTISQMLPNGFNNDTMIRYIPALYISLFFCGLLVFAAMFIKYAFCAWVLTLFIGALGKRLELHLDFGEKFMMAFYAESLSMIISNFASAVNLLPVDIISIISIFLAFRMTSVATMSYAKDFISNNKNDRQNPFL